MGLGRRHGGGGGHTLVSRLESETCMEYLNLLQLYGLEISLAGTCALSYRQRYIYSNKKITSAFHDTVSINPVRMSQQKSNQNVNQT